MALGKGAKARSTRSVAIGKYATTATKTPGAVALGAHSRVEQSGQNSVALGQYSVANQANTVSVGNSNLKRRITNVADGINPYDAVNMRQFNQLGYQVNKLDKKVSGIGAMSSAMSALVPNSRIEEDTQISAGFGYYDSQVAIAAGLFHYVNDDVLLNAAASYAKESGVAARAGITWAF